MRFCLPRGKISRWLPGLRLALATCLVLFACKGSTPTNPHRQDKPSLGLGRRSLSVSFNDYLVKIQYGNPFGIVRLKAHNQARGFAHNQLPLADWEWFWLGDGSKRSSRTKLVQRLWPVPDLVVEPNRFVVSFKRDISLDGIDFHLGIDYILYPNSALDAIYRIRNKSTKTARKPYAMIGFPGFSRPKAITQVANGTEARSPRAPSTNFRQEILALGHEESTLLWHDWPPGNREPLVNKIALLDSERRWTLEARYTPDENVAAVSTGHVLKPAYLTSHLYAVFRDMPAGSEQTLKVHYRLYDSSQETSSTNLQE